jgi:hypothetical protein
MPDAKISLGAVALHAGGCGQYSVEMSARNELADRIAERIRDRLWSQTKHVLASGIVAWAPGTEAAADYFDTINAMSIVEDSSLDDDEFVITVDGQDYTYSVDLRITRR